MTTAGTIVLSSANEENADPYVAALVASGVPAGRLRLLTPERDDLRAAGAVVEGAAGLLLCGGLDVEPRRYDEDELPGAGLETNPQRDLLEWALLDAARAAHTPVLGICRGMQVVNVFLGGSLYQDLPRQHGSDILHSQHPSHHPQAGDDPPERIAHTVSAADAAHPLAALLSGDPSPVNSRHHQAVKRLAPDLVPLATAPDGVVEACALDPGSAWWLLAVQWHPENLLALSAQRALWSRFVAATREAR